MTQELARWTNVALSSGALIIVVALLVQRWSQTSRSIRRVVVCSAGVLAVIAYGSGEAATQDVPAGARVVAMLIALCSLVAALVGLVRATPSPPTGDR